MTTTNTSATKKYCVNNGKWCEFANLQGFCTMTACCRGADVLGGRKMTNLEYLRTLSAEELVTEISAKCDVCAYRDIDCKNETCKGGFIEWLKQEWKFELKPCPFCGEEPKTIHYSDGYYIRCDNCLARIFTRITEGEAIEAWNRRVK